MLSEIMKSHQNRSADSDPLKIIKTSSLISTACQVHKLSYDQLPGGALIVADRDKITQLWGRSENKARMLDTLSFCRDKMHFELLNRPPVIIFVTELSIDCIRAALYSKTGFSKPHEFTAYYLQYGELCAGIA